MNSSTESSQQLPTALGYLYDEVIEPTRLSVFLQDAATKFGCHAGAFAYYSTSQVTGETLELSCQFGLPGSYGARYREGLYYLPQGASAPLPDGYSRRGVES